MPTTVLFNSPQSGSQFNAGTTNTIATVDIVNFTRFRVYCECNNGGQATFNIRVLNASTGNNSNKRLATVTTLAVGRNTNRSQVFADLVAIRLQVEAVIPSFASNLNNTTTRVVVMILAS